MDQQQPPTGIIPDEEIPLHIELLQQVGTAFGSMIHEVFKATHNQHGAMIRHGFWGNSPFQRGPNICNLRSTAVRTTEKCYEIHVVFNRFSIVKLRTQPVEQPFSITRCRSFDHSQLESVANRSIKQSLQPQLLIDG